jgi:hypothetical protein
MAGATLRPVAGSLASPQQRSASALVADGAVSGGRFRYFDIAGGFRYARKFLELDAAAFLPGQKQLAELPRASRDDDAEWMGADMENV